MFWILLMVWEICINERNPHLSQFFQVLKSIKKKKKQRADPSLLVVLSSIIIKLVHLTSTLIQVSSTWKVSILINNFQSKHSSSPPHQTGAFRYIETPPAAINSFSNINSTPLFVFSFSFSLFVNLAKELRCCFPLCLSSFTPKPHRTNLLMSNTTAETMESERNQKDVWMKMKKINIGACMNEGLQFWSHCGLIYGQIFGEQWQFWRCFLGVDFECRWWIRCKSWWYINIFIVNGCCMNTMAGHFGFDSILFLRNYAWVFSFSYTLQSLCSNGLREKKKKVEEEYETQLRGLVVRPH